MRLNPKGNYIQMEIAADCLPHLSPCPHCGRPTNARYSVCQFCGACQPGLDPERQAAAVRWIFMQSEKYQIVWIGEIHPAMPQPALPQISARIALDPHPHPRTVLELCSIRPCGLKSSNIARTVLEPRTVLEHCSNIARTMLELCSNCARTLLDAVVRVRAGTLEHCSNIARLKTALSNTARTVLEHCSSQKVKENCNI